MSVGGLGWHGKAKEPKERRKGLGGGKEELGMERPLPGIPFLGSGFTSWHWRTSS